MLSQSGPLVNQVPLQVMSPNDPGESTGVQIYDGVSRPVPNAMEIDGGSHIHFGLSQAAMINIWFIIADCVNLFAGYFW